MYIPTKEYIIYKSTTNIVKFILIVHLFYLNFALAKDYNRSNPEPMTKQSYNSQKVFSENYMIVTADKRASIAADKILSLGGNALDAAIAAQNVLAVVEPQSSGLGGGGFLLYYEKSNNKIIAYDGRETASSLAKENMFTDSNNNKITFIDAVSKPYSVGVPGLYTMLADAHLEYGNLNWEQLFSSAIFHAEEFEISPRLFKLLNWAPHIKKNKFVQSIYFENSKPKEVGKTVKNLELKKSLEILSLDPYSLRTGLLAKKISKELIGFMPLNDIKSWNTIKRKPICKIFKSVRKNLPVQYSNSLD